MSSLIEIGLSNLVVSGFLALVAAAVGRCCRRPALTHGLWLLVFVKLITPPLVPVRIGWSAPMSSDKVASRLVDRAKNPERLGTDRAALPPNAEVDPQVLDQEPEGADGQPGPVLEQPIPEPAALPLVRVLPVPRDVEKFTVASTRFPWALATAGIWLGGSVLWLLLAGRRVCQFQRLLKHSRPVAVDLHQEVALLANRLRIRSPQVWLVPGVLSPMIWVLGSSRRLLLPEHLLGRLSTEQRQTLLAHELAHLKRGDPWVRYLELVVLALYWWCPLVWWARAELREAEEECCDAWVVWALPGSARAYALALVETVDFVADARPALPALASGFGHVQTLRRRLTMIMRGTTPRTLTASSALALVAVGFLALPLLPTWGQEPRASGSRISEDETARSEIENLQALIGHLREDVDQAQKRFQIEKADVDALTRDLHKKLELLANEQRQPAVSVNKKVEKRFTVGNGHPGVSTPRPELERRLQEIERKLVEALRELQDLRRQLGSAARLPSLPPPLYQIPAPQPGAVPNPPPPLGYVMPLGKRP